MSLASTQIAKAPSASSAQKAGLKSPRVNRTPNDATYFLPYQVAWIRDQSHLRLCEKGRQIGLSYADSYDSVRKAAPADVGRDVWVMSRDEIQAKQYILYCKRWANVLRYAAEDLGEQVLMSESGKSIQVQVLKFASGASIYALSSNPDAIVGKTGHVKLDEYALHKAQRELFAVAKPVIQWGGTLTIISTHRGVGTVFNQLIRDIKERGNPMGWSLHTIPIQRAVEDGIVEKINAATGRSETREAWLARQRAECIDEEQWLQEYCCVPADESTAFLSYELITAAEDDTATKDWEYLHDCPNPLYVGFDVARKHDLSVIDIEEKVGDVFWERMRIEMRDCKYGEQWNVLSRVMALRSVRRCCIDSTGIGNQLAEDGEDLWRGRFEAINFTNQVKSDLAYPLLGVHQDRKIRYPSSAALKADLRGIKKEYTTAGNERFVGDSPDSHCDRFWAKALAIQAGMQKSASFSSVLI